MSASFNPPQEANGPWLRHSDCQRVSAQGNLFSLSYRLILLHLCQQQDILLTLKGVYFEHFHVALLKEAADWFKSFLEFIYAHKAYGRRVRLWSYRQLNFW